VLQNFSLRIPRGFRLGVAGESGSGKSTLMNLIFRFYDPTAGCIRMDGQDLRDISVFDLRSQLALVSQDVVLFDQTVAENIAHGKPGATTAEVEAAARASYAHDFIMRLPSGYQTRIGEAGKLLSGGQTTANFHCARIRSQRPDPGARRGDRESGFECRSGGAGGH